MPAVVHEVDESADVEGHRQQGPAGIGPGHTHALSARRARSVIARVPIGFRTETACCFQLKH
jgi:hypothetical protein